jgi:nicotinamidase-related amidase
MDPMNHRFERVRREQSALLAIDVQERLLPTISDRVHVLQNAVRLLQGAALLQVPVWVTEQYRKGLGATVPEIRSVVPEWAPFEKLAFSACGAEGLVPALRAKGRTDVVLCGIETHVCVLQTCLDLLMEEFRVFVVADATSSRTPENRQLGIERMGGAGAVIVSTEMVLFEMLGQAGTPEFKQILGLIR